MRAGVPGFLGVASRARVSSGSACGEWRQGFRKVMPLEPHAKRQKLAQHRRVGLGRDVGLARDPVEDVVVAGREQALVLVELRLAERRDMGARELAKEDVV